jgi:hypothetical protein
MLDKYPLNLSLFRSQDDPFLLYAAMHGGIGTYFVSKDFMRTHKHRLGDVELANLFRKWQLARQYSIFFKKATGKGQVIVSVLSCI